MTDRDRLMLHEEVMLLALRDDAGTVASGTVYQYALGGAILAELLLNERVRVDDSGRTPRAIVADATPLGAHLLDECLEQIAAARRPRTLEAWVGKFAGKSALKHRVAQRLVQRGILRQEQGRFLLVFSRTIYPETDARPEREILKRLRAAIFSDAGEVDPRTVVLLALADNAKLLPLAFDRRELKRRTGRIAQIVNGDASGRATKAAIQAMQTAVLVAAVVPVIVTSN